MGFSVASRTCDSANSLQPETCATRMGGCIWRWLQEGFYSRVGRSRRHDFRPGSLAFLESHEGHTDTYAGGSKCLHVVIPLEKEGYSL